MRGFAWVALMAMTCLAAREAVALEVRLAGIDRLYFEPMAEPGPSHADAVRTALPLTLAGAPATGETPGDADGHDVPVSIADFPVPGLARGTSIVLREVTERSRRIHGVWWALYGNGRRQDVWFFEASPERTGGKALANPAIERVRRKAGREVVVDILSAMIRPQGAAWTSAWTLTFALTPDGLCYRHAEERYGMSRGYDLGDTAPTVTYWSAHRRGRLIEVKTADQVPDAILVSCGANEQDELESDTLGARLARVARCVTSKAKVRVSKRAIDTPGFIERGGKPLE